MCCAHMCRSTSVVRIYMCCNIYIYIYMYIYIIYIYICIYMYIIYIYVYIYNCTYCVKDLYVHLHVLDIQHSKCC